MEFLDAHGVALAPGDKVEYWSAQKKQWLDAEVVLIEGRWTKTEKFSALFLKRWDSRNNRYEYGAPIRLLKSENVVKL